MRGARWTWAVIALASVLASLAACSAIVNPDLSRLEPDAELGIDAGTVQDAAPRTDAAREQDARTIDGSWPLDDGSQQEAGITQDAGPTCAGTCDDGIACTLDACVDGACTHMPDNTRCPRGERCDARAGCLPLHCERDADCDDGLFCNGVERCDPRAGGRGCVAGTPVVCEDGRSCTIDVCNEDLDRCVRMLDDASCEDGMACTLDRCEPAASSSPDGCVHVPDDTVCADAASCTIDRCDPTRSTSPDGCVHLGDDASCSDSVACTIDRCDPAASTSADGCTHTPSDAACSELFCTTGARCDAMLGCVGGSPRDCRDRNPCTSDFCDEASRMCINPLRDDDGDGYPAASVRSGGAWVACGGTDCNDSNAAIHPGAPEVCGNSTDDNCNGAVDEDCARAGDVCATAIPISLSGGSATVTGSIAGFSDDYQTDPVCGAGMGGRDVVYYFDVNGVGDVTMDTIGSSFDTVLAVGTECTPTGLREACNDNYDERVSRTSRIWLHRVGSLFGTTRVYVLVDAFDAGASSGTYTLNVRVRNPAAADSCWGPMDISGGGTVLGFQTNVTGMHRGSCAPSLLTAPEAIFRVTGPPSGNMDFLVRSRDFTPILYLRSNDCSIGTEVGCVVGAPLGTGVNEAHLRIGARSGMAYFFFVDGGRGRYIVYYRPF